MRNYVSLSFVNRMGRDSLSVVPIAASPFTKQHLDKTGLEKKFDRRLACFKSSLKIAKESSLKGSYFSFKPNLFCEQGRIHRAHESRRSDVNVNVVAVILALTTTRTISLIDDAGAFRYGNRSLIATATEY